jgi:general secretion pathway protein B
VSLILDALRKADAERDRGSVPSLHSQPVVTTADAEAKPRGGPNLLLIALGVAVGVLGAAALWVMFAREAPRTAPATPPVAAAPAPAPATAPAVAPMQAAPAAPPATPAPLPGGSAPVAEPAPWPRPDERTAPAPEAKANPGVPVLGNVPVGPPPVVPRDQLPPDIRAQLPAFTIGGSIYSPVPSARSLIVNGQLFREKDRLNPDLTLDEIKLKAAVFSFRGYRFEVPF